MKRPTLTSISTLSLMAAGVAAFSVMAPAKAEDVKFQCGTSQGVPATVAVTSRGSIPVIRYTSGYFADSGYSPLYRCQVVSPKFQKYSKEGTLNYLTTGLANNQPIVCVAANKGGPCTGVLFTLKPGSDPWQTLTRLMNVRVQAGPPLNESSTGSSPATSSNYIDMNEYLSTAPVEVGSAPEASPVAPQSNVDASVLSPSGGAAPVPANGLW